MKVIIVGCGRVGSALASQMSKRDDQVIVIDAVASAFENLPLDFHGRTIEGDVLAQNVLHRAEIETADALAAVTNSDTLNALVAHIARTEYQVANVVARNYDPSQRNLQEAFGIPVISSAGWGAQRIEELLSNAPLRLVFLDSKAHFALYQLEVGENWHGRPLREMLPAGQIQVVEYKRLGQPMQISWTQTVETGDLIYLSGDPKAFEGLRQHLGILPES